MRRSLTRDAMIPLGLAALAAFEAATHDAPRLGALLAALWVSCALLVTRRRWPWAAPTAAGLLTLSTPLLGPEIDELASPIPILAVACFTLARHLPDLRGTSSVALFALVVLTVTGEADVTDVVFVASLLSTPYVLGRVLRALAVRNERLAEQAELLTRLQDTVRVDAVDAERARIARELHDVMAHSVSAMVVQAAAAQDLVRTDPDRAATVLGDLAATGRRALAETGRLLHLVRDPDDELGLAPDPGLDRVEDLVEQFRRSGLDVDLHVDGPLSGVPAGVGLSGYRIVQEALTNALKYAPDRRVRLCLQREAAGLRVEAENRGAPGPRTGSGLGLVGMAERVSVFGGSLEHGYTRDGRFTLSAFLPLQSVDA